MPDTKELRNYINGEWRASSGSTLLDVLNPANQDVLAEVALSTESEVDEAVNQAQAALADWRRTPATERIQYLFKLKMLLEDHFEEISRLITMECGKTLGESRGEMRRAIEGFKKVGEEFLCSACGHKYASEAEVPYKEVRKAQVFDESDKAKVIDIFDDEERGKNCRYCEHYLVNPFTQRCAMHFKEVKATDFCDDFEPKSEEEAD